MAHFYLSSPSEARGERKGRRKGNNRMVMFWVREAFSKEEMDQAVLGPACSHWESLCVSPWPQAGYCVLSHPFPHSHPHLCAIGVMVAVLMVEYKTHFRELPINGQEW